ncbi:hypothetical protein V6N12_026237 [Hibiscus sabdariffa]|uniref:Beta-fructofuranosidase n=1 Tax=Hibiscus sabdariffa TaxID=183260 RepID=A0ABR2DSW4_9ROSI
MFRAILYVYEKKDGGSKSHFSAGYKQDQFRMMNIKVTGKVTAIMNNKDEEIKKIIPEKRLSRDHWPEYYDTRSGRFIGKQSRLYQTWTIAGFLTSKMMVKNPEMASMLFWDEDLELLEICVCALSKSGRIRCSCGALKLRYLCNRTPYYTV